MMKVFTKLGFAMVLGLLSTSLLWAQHTAEEIAAKNQSLIQMEQVYDVDPDAKPIGNIPPSDDLFDLQFSWPAGVGGGEAGLETDGNYVYTTKWNGTGEFYRYAMDGTYIEVFTVSGTTGARDLAYNGTYFYAGAASTTVWEIDLDAQVVVSQFTAPTAVRAIAYNEDDNVFYANNWSTDITAFDPTGANQGSFATGPFGASYYGLAYSNYCGGQFLWGYAQVGATPADQNWLVQIELPSGAETGVTYNVASVVTPVTGIAGGLCVTDAVVPGFWTIMGNMQNEFIWGLELCTAGPLPDNDLGIQAIVEPSTGANLTSAEEVTVTIKNYGNNAQSNFDVWFTLDGGTPVTETYSGTLNGGETVNHTFATTVDLSAMGTYDFEACTDLTGDENPDNDCKTKTVENLAPAYCDASTTTEDEYIANVLFGTIDNTSGWQGGVADYTDQSTSVPQGGSEDMTVTNGNAWAADEVSVWVDWNMDYVLETGGDEEYMLTNVGGTGETFEGSISVPAGTPEGDYRMRIRMMYNATPVPCGNESYGEVEDYTLTVGEGGPTLNPPTNLVANVVGPDNNDVELMWDAPAGGGSGEWIFWDAQTNDDGIGLTNGGTFMAASRWEPTDLAAYDGQYLSKISYYHYNNAATATFTLMVWTGADAGTLVHTQAVTSSVVDAWNEITLTDAIMIDASDELWFGFETTHAAGENPAGVDAGPAVAGKGDMISLDGTSWVSMSIEYSLDYNWNLAGYVSADGDGGESVPMVKTTPSVIASPSFTMGSENGAVSSNKKFVPSSAKDLLGYNVYRDGTAIGFTTETNYLDEDLADGTYDYYVTAEYDEGESGPTNTETVTIDTGGPGMEIFCDDFDSYTVGQQLVSQNPDDWTTWSGTAGNAEDPFIVDNGGNVVEITGTNDLVYEMPDYTDGGYEITFDIYIPDGADGYFNTLQDFAGASSQWGMQVYFGETNPGEGNIDGGGALAALFTFDYDTWMNVKVTVDLQNDWGEFFLDGTLIHGWVWSSGSFGTGTLNQLGGNNFYAWDGGAYGNPLFHIDNYCLNEMNVAVFDPPTNVTATLEGTNDVLVDWDPPASGGQLVELSQHDGNPDNGYFQAYDNGYGVVFDISAYPGATLEYVDFHHASWGVFGTHDYSFHIVDWDTYTEVDETPVMQTTGDDVWEELVPIGSIAGQSGLVGIFLEPMSNDPADAYPCLDADNVGPDGMSYNGPLSDYSAMTLSTIGDFLIDLWIMTDDGKLVEIQPQKVDATNINTSDIARNGINPLNVNSYEAQQQANYGKGTLALTGYNVSRDGDFIDFVAIPTTEYLDENLAPGTYTYCVSAVYDDGESQDACADPVTVPNPTPPPPPTNFVLDLVEADVELSWDEPGNEWMRWDAGVNNGNGIGLTNGGTFGVSSHWDPASLAPYNGLSIETITFYANADPAATFTIKVWTGVNGLNEIYSQDVTSYTVDDWNDIALTTPIEIDANDHLWFGYEVTHGAGTFPAGCDDGPAVAGYGDMILTGGAWASLVGINPSLDYNWNIAAFVVAADGKSQLMGKPVTPSLETGELAEQGATGVVNKFNPSNSKELTGYNVWYKMDNGSYSVLDFTTDNFYVHEGNAYVVGTHCYQITAVYDPQGESDPTDEECFTFVGTQEFTAENVQLYPNPARDVVNIKSDVTITSVTVYNYSGQIVANEQVDNTVYSVNTSELRSGIYFFQIDTDNGRISQRIVIE